MGHHHTALLKNKTLLISLSEQQAPAQAGHTELVGLRVVRGLEHICELRYTVLQSYAQWGNKRKKIHKIGVSQMK